MIRFALSAALSLSVAFCLAGCDSGKSGTSDYGKAPKGTPPAAHSHEHHEHGPHGGHIVELGGEDYHGEVCFDKDGKKLVVYILGSDAKKAMPIDAAEVTLSLKIEEKVQPFTLKAAPLEGETGGKSSKFELANDLTIASSIKDEEDLEGNLSVKIGEKSYNGNIEHHHEEGKKDDHDHGKKDEKKAEPAEKKEGGSSK